MNTMTHSAAPPAVPRPAQDGPWRRAWRKLARNRIAMAGLAVVLFFIVVAVFAPWIAPHDPTDLAKLDLLDSRTPPLWLEGGDKRFLLGTDNQGRDMLSAILYGLQISIGVSVLAVMLAMTIEPS